VTPLFCAPEICQVVGSSNGTDCPRGKHEKKFIAGRGGGMGDQFCHEIDRYADGKNVIG
jgi:hypothetical protein